MTEPAFFRIQREFTRYLRDPDNAPKPANVDPKSLAVYANAVIANTNVFIGDNFPRVKSILSERAWTELLRDYFIRHESKTSLFVELPSEFLVYLEEVRECNEDPAFLLELAHFDLLENIVSTDVRRLDESLVNREGDLLVDELVLNPTSQLVRYAFPVHRIDPDYQPTDPPAEPTFILAFRDRANKYGFIDVNAATARMVELLLTEHGMSGARILNTIAQELRHPDLSALTEAGKSILSRLAARDVVLGTKR